jgi:hypothetical protein
MLAMSALPHSVQMTHPRKRPEQYPVSCQDGRKVGQNGGRYWQYFANSGSMQMQCDDQLKSLRSMHLQY